MVVIYLVNMFIVGIVVTGHYECLYRINLLTPKLPMHHRLRIVLGAILAVTAHIFEIWIFGIAAGSDTVVKADYFTRLLVYGCGAAICSVCLGSI